MLDNKLIKKIMKLNIAIVLLCNFLFQSCSSVKVLDSWKDDNLQDVKNKTINLITCKIEC